MSSAAAVSRSCGRRLTGPRANDPKQSSRTSALMGRPPRGGIRRHLCDRVLVRHAETLPSLQHGRGLGAAGYAVHVMDFDRLDDIRRHRWRASVLVLFRAKTTIWRAWPKFLNMPQRRDAARLRYRRSRLRSSYADRIRCVAPNGPYQRRFTSERSRRRRAAARCDLVTVSTAPLAKIANAWGVRPPSFRIRSTAADAGCRRAGGCAAAPA